MDKDNEIFSKEQRKEINKMIETAKREIIESTDDRIRDVEDYIRREEELSSYFPLLLMVFCAGIGIYYKK